MIFTQRAKHRINEAPTNWKSGGERNKKIINRKVKKDLQKLLWKRVWAAHENVNQDRCA